ncbi:MAG: radical SAM protein [candidate division KSB1 bacterium]|nr:radical SAM protein [candidate division KSB1 bacterium]
MRRVRATVETYRFQELARRWLSQEERCLEPKEGAPFSFLLVYPNSYEVGMSNLGFQRVYWLVNSEPDWRCERAFFYPLPWGAQLRSLESAQRGGSFHAIGFSCSYELDYPRVVSQIASTGVPLRASERTEGHPLFLLGGAVTFFNPTPLAPFFDVVVLGEAEPVLPALLERIASGWHWGQRRSLLQSLAELPGVWCPPLEPEPHRKIRLVWRDRDSLPAWSCLVSPEAHMEDSFLVEVARGCGRRCRFCVTSHVYYPYRLWPKERVLEVVDTRNRNGHRVGLVGAALSDYPELPGLLEGLVARGLSFSLSSLRIDHLDRELLSLLERGGVRSVTLAPETASPRLQRVIRKNLQVDKMLEAADLLAGSEIPRVKLYFLIGLPTETDDDVEETARFVREFGQRLLSADSSKRLTVSVNAFVPKPHTPFQWCGMAARETLERRRGILRRSVRGLKGIELEVGRHPEEFLQAVFSLGGSELAAALEHSFLTGCSLREAFARVGVQTENLVYVDKAPDTHFPWDFIAGGPTREVLTRQLELARGLAKAQSH